MLCEGRPVVYSRFFQAALIAGHVLPETYGAECNGEPRQGAHEATRHPPDKRPSDLSDFSSLPSLSSSSASRGGAACSAPSAEPTVPMDETGAETAEVTAEKTMTSTSHGTRDVHVATDRTVQGTLKREVETQALLLHVAPSGATLSLSAATQMYDRLEARLTAAHADPSFRSLAHALHARLPLLVEFVVFDTETSGISSHDVVVQMAWAAYDPDGLRLEYSTTYWSLPCGVQVSHGAYAVHKIGAQLLSDRGSVPTTHLRTFWALVYVMRARGKKVVAHNAAFDVRLLNQTAQAWGLGQRLSIEDTFCTMRSATPYCGLRNRAGHKKAPRNSELFQVLTGDCCDETQLHDAAVDISVTATSYRLGRARRWWT